MDKLVRKAVRCFIFDNNKVLTIKYKEPNKRVGWYDIPGGKIEKDKKTIDTAIREVCEETTLKVTNLDRKGNLIVEYPDRIFDFEVFVARDFLGNPTELEENYAEWIDITELLSKDNIFSNIQLLNKEYINYLKGNNSDFKMHIYVDSNENITNIEFDENNEQIVNEISKNFWNNIHIKYGNNPIKYDNWLEIFNKYIFECDRPVIDLGCGRGNNTLYLIEKGKEVIPCDFSKIAVEIVRKNFPQIKNVNCFDMTKGLPFEDNYTDLLICDLSLHYFTEITTIKILNEISRVLTPNGKMLFRVNSINDINYVAGQGIEIEKHLYKTDDGTFKRFFDENDIKKIFKNWKILYINEEKTGRYDKEKILWKCAIQNNK